VQGSKKYIAHPNSFQARIAIGKFEDKALIVGGFLFFRCPSNTAVESMNPLGMNPHRA